MLGSSMCSGMNCRLFINSRSHETYASNHQPLAMEWWKSRSTSWWPGQENRFLRPWIVAVVHFDHHCLLSHPMTVKCARTFDLDWNASYVYIILYPYVHICTFFCDPELVQSFKCSFVGFQSWRWHIYNHPCETCEKAQSFLTNAFLCITLYMEANLKG